MSTNHEILASFADTGSDHFSKPWQDGEYVYATNREWAVRMPASAFAQGAFDRAVAGKHPKQIGGMFDAAPWHRLKALPHIDAPAACPACLGSGWSKEITPVCDSCGGEGVFKHAGLEYDCRKCDDEDRSKYTPCKPGDPGAERCPACDATGYDSSTERRENAIQIDSTWLQARYIKRISELPGVLFATDDDRHKTCAFKFDGGEGLLMPRYAPKGETP